jgi:hypothetical protein
MNTFVAYQAHPSSRHRLAAPGVHWIFVLLLGAITCGLFLWFSEIYLSVWSRKLRRKNQASAWYLGSVAVLLVEFFLASMLPFCGVNNPGIAAFLRIGSLMAAVCFLLIGRLELCTVLQEYFTTEEPYGLKLNRFLSALLGAIYFQYWLRKIRSLQDYQYQR